MSQPCCVLETTSDRSRRAGLFGILLRVVPVVAVLSCDLFTEPEPVGLGITVQPAGSAQSGIPLSPQPVVQLRDADGGDVAQSGVTVTAAIASGGGTLGGTTTALTDVDGRAAFTDLTITGTIGARTLRFSAAGLADATSNTINLSAGEPTRLAISTEPSSDVQSGVAFATQPVVQLRDASGNDAGQSGVSVTASIASGDGTLGGSVTAATNSSGQAVFANLSISGLVGNRTLAFAATGLTGATSGTIAVAPGPPSQLAMTSQPAATAVSGVALTTQPAVRLRDAAGNTVSQSGVSVSAELASGGGTLGGTTTVQTGSTGQAAFTNLVITGLVGGRTLRFTSTGLTAATSDMIAVSAGPASQLVITTAPSDSVQSGVAFGTQPAVQLRDASGNAVGDSGVAVTAAIASGGGTLGGTTAAATNATGQAVFTDLSITGTVGPRTLTFAVSGLTAATSDTIAVLAGPATQVAITTEPPTTAQNGLALNPQPVVQLRDASGNAVAESGVSVTASIESGGGTLGGTTSVVTDTDGQAAFTDLSISGTVGVRVLRFAASGLTHSLSNAIAVAAGPATHLAITTQPSASASSGIAFATQPVVEVRDVSGNAVLQSGVSVTASIASGGGTLGGTTTVATDGSGQATFTDLSITGTSGDRTLGFASGTLTTATSNAVTVTVTAATQLVITTQPSDTAQAEVWFGTQPVVQLRDATNTDVLQSGVPVTAAIASGGGTLGGTTTVQTNGNGQAVFTNLSITGTPGPRTLGFSSGALTGVVSDTIVVTAAPGCTLSSPGDADGDRLPDCVETNTGVFVSELDTGTDPNDPDTDNDAIKDGDEVLGTLLGLDLPAMGVSPLRQDILIEYDWFDDNAEPGTCSAHSHRPTAAVAAMVAAAFANAPVTNPDGSTGVNFIQDYGQGGVFTGGNLIPDADGVIADGVSGAEFLGYKAAHFAANRNGYFHYTLLPHRYNTNSTSSGQAEVWGDDLIVSLYCYGSDKNVAHTIMHELGHNLGIRHGGNVVTNYIPNYNSIMNYKYQFPGIDNDCTPPGNGVMDYSIGVRPALDENNLDETQGVCGNPPGPGWDWNGDGDASDVGIAEDINKDSGGTGDGVLEILRDYNDWANLYFAGIGDADGASLVAKEIVTCTNPPPPERRQ